MAAQNQMIRKVLIANPNIDTATLANRLNTTKQAVYQTRHDLKKEFLAKQALKSERARLANVTRSENVKPLSDYVLELLETIPDGLSVEEIAVGVKNAGYITRSSMFIVGLRRRLLDLSKGGKILKNGGNYKHRQPIKLSASIGPMNHQDVKSEQASSPMVGVSSNNTNNTVILEENPVLNILTDLSKLCKRAGGIDAIDEFLNVLRELQDEGKS